ncbi:hypothetical protein PPL_09702 [Heterostelium album PN500]|uniref:Bacterial toxin 8 domain-containing protein n=1 Tax=Heterostelium pallidum (strain ATCC 26659 / Pp 5 / PN500) TaxID=670386 RepID=D3BNJ9_HETP5|nr:hypothetical protein PPL_09702 [Heterostelium album PN500]EFA76950.1 hypothetical protein PPL_09702 [Heterostelium album PN500]|eukprot:XP_020429082.1 hypothetical protein PPL_09702 [Heterostelium album PN500]
MAHHRGFEAAKGFSYKFSSLQVIDLHRLQHRYDQQGKLNKTPQWYLQQQAKQQEQMRTYRENRSLNYQRYESAPKPGSTSENYQRYENNPNPGGVSLIPNVSHREKVVISGTKITVNGCSYFTNLTLREVEDLRKAISSTLGGVTISLEMGTGCYQRYLDGLKPESPLCNVLMDADKLLGALVFGIDYFTGMKATCLVEGYENHLDARTRLLSMHGGVTRLGYDKFSNILPHPTFVLNPNYVANFDKSTNTIKFNGQALIITIRGRYFDWKGNDYYDDDFQVGKEMFPFLDHFNNNYSKYLACYPYLNRLAEYARVLILLSMGSTRDYTATTMTSIDKFEEGHSLTTSEDPEVLPCQVALLDAQMQATLNNIESEHFPDHAILISRSYKNLKVRIDACCTLLIAAMIKVSKESPNYAVLAMELSSLLVDNYDSITDFDLLLSVFGTNNIDVIIHYLLGIAHENAMDQCNDSLLVDIYGKLAGDRTKLEGILQAWGTDSRMDRFWQLFRKAIHRFPKMEKRKPGVMSPPGLIQAISEMSQCIEQISKFDSTSVYISVCFSMLEMFHAQLAIYKHLFMAEELLSKSKFERNPTEALSMATQAKSLASSCLGVTNDARYICYLAADRIADIYASTGGSSDKIAQWRRLSNIEKESLLSTDPEYLNQLNKSSCSIQ